VWISELSQAGADPLVGCKLLGLCEAAGFQVWVELVHIPQPAQAEALSLIDDLPRTHNQRQIAQNVRGYVESAAGDWAVFLHVPYFLIVATKL